MSAQAIASEVLAEVDPMLHKIAWEFARQHGGDHEELKAEANLIFMQAYRRYRPDTTMWERHHHTQRAQAAASFSTWVYMKVKFGLRDTARRLAKEKLRFPRIAQSERGAEWRDLILPERFDVERFLFDLSDDAKAVAVMALDPPPEVRLTALQSRGLNNPRSVRKGISEFLTDLGWDSERIVEAFLELRDALER